MGLDYRVNCCPDGLVTDRRRRIKVLDCTIRDGGICNDWHFDHEAVKNTFEALAHAGIDYMEIGYRTKAGVSDRNKVGPWRFCDEKDLEKAGVKPGALKMATMVDVGKVEKSDIPAKRDTVIDVVRIATYAHQMDGALDLLDHCLKSGYETFMNVMAVSTLKPEEVDAFLHRLRGTGVHNVALVDSFGALYPYHVRYLIRKYMNYLGQDIKVGVHMHNNQQNAFANSIAAIDEGADFVDATIHGIGRGAGNCPLELLLMYLDNPKYDARHIMDMAEWFAFLRDDLRWGYHVPYVITGYYNVHPKSGIDRMAREDRYQVREMYESLMGRFSEREDEKKKLA
jgi:4-hydroxy 2-oxovalerate aldolase